MLEPKTHALYRFFGAGGTLLYIGITNSRLEHTNWFDFIRATAMGTSPVGIVAPSGERAPGVTQQQRQGGARVWARRS